MENTVLPVFLGTLWSSLPGKAFFEFLAPTNNSYPASQIISFSVLLHSPQPLSVPTVHILDSCTQTPAWSNESSSLCERIWSQKKTICSKICAVHRPGHIIHHKSLAPHWGASHERLISVSSYTFFATPKFPIGQTPQLYISIHLQTKKSGLDAGPVIMSLNKILEVPLRNYLEATSLRVMRGFDRVC